MLNVRTSGKSTEGKWEQTYASVYTRSLELHSPTYIASIGLHAKKT